MGRALDVVENIMKDKECYEEMGLVFPEHKRKWRKFNLLVGENGSGKSRILQIVKRKTPKDCIVINLDFANHVPSYKTEESSDDVEYNLLEGLIFRNVNNDVKFLDFLEYLDNQIVLVFDELFAKDNIENRHLNRRLQEILNDLSPAIENILHREVIVGEQGICLCKGTRKIPIKSEWELFSPGEKSILRVVFAALVIKLVNKPCILLIDELETHLHPNAQTELYKLLKQALNESASDYCVCIASHSIFLLPLFDIQELVYINNGEIRKINGGIYQQIYDSLTGEGDRQEESLADFFYSMEAWQYAEYLAECFIEPQTVDIADGNDEQALKFVEILKTMYSQKKSLEVLDFGAGSARIGRCLELMLKNDIEVLELASKLKYHIYDRYDISDEFKENSAWMGRAYQSEEDIRLSARKFDIILLYNVLHEIEISEWVKELEFMLDSLTENGFLLFSEREVLSIGEKPYGKSGYLVLGKQELAELFPKSEIQEIKLPNKDREVTCCFSIKKPISKSASYLNEKTVKAALKVLKDNTKRKIKNRNNNGLGEKGKSRKYAFYCQQYVNVEEAIEILEDVDPGIYADLTLSDILQSSLSLSEKTEKISELAKEDTEEGKKSRKYLEMRRNR